MTERQVRFLPDHDQCLRCSTYGAWDCSKHKFDQMPLMHGRGGFIADVPVFLVKCDWFEQKLRPKISSPLDKRFESVV